MMNLIFNFLFSLALLAAPPKTSIVLNADNYKTNADKTADLEGNVKVVRDAEILTCDKAKINNATGDVFAQGNVVFITPTNYIRAEKMSYNFISKKGVIYNGLIQTGQETTEGEVIYKTGEDQFTAERASYTSCVNCPPSWKLSGKKIDATVGGYAYISQPVIRIYNIPLLWLPWIAIPIKNTRQSGLLAPNIENKGSSGSAFGLNYFWAIDDSKDATFSGTYYDTRGFKSGLEYRYVSDANSRGYFRATYLNDRFFPYRKDFVQLDSRYAGTGSTRPEAGRTEYLQRYSIKFNQHVDLPEGFTHNAKVNLISDTRYLYDFSEDMLGAGEPALDNRFNISKNTENTHSSADVSLYQNLLKVDPLGPNDQTVHRMPEIKYSMAPQKILKYGLLGLDFDYINFANSGKTFYGSGTTFNLASDKYRTGQRAAIHPTLSLPINLWNFFDMLPQVEYEEIFYQFGYSSKPTTTRRFVRTSLNLKTRLSAIYGEENLDVYATKHKHEIIPEFNYSVIPSFYQENHPFFGSQTLPFSPNYTSNQPVTEFDDAIQFDYRDRLVDQNIITYALTNKIIRKTKDQGGASYREMIYHRFSQSYDVYSSRLPDLYTALDGSLKPTIKQPWGELRSYFALNLDRVGFTSDISYYPYEVKTIYSYGLGLNNGKGDGLSIGYSQGYQIRPNYYDPSVSRLIFGARSETASISTYFTTKYLNFNGTTAFDISNKWNPTSFTIRGLIKPPGKCWGFGFYFYKVFGGEQAFAWTLPIFFGEGRSFDVGG